uniref:Uncharacterized protein n=1 Tax=Hyaloperonospora arabidopsidis (strain Emoy2) TaxID=559515 RepID=M4BK10_HYAAE
MNQKVGDWIDVKDLSSNKWSVTHIMHQNASEIRAHIPTWRKGCDEFLSRLKYRNRFVKLDKHTNVYMSSAYPFLRKQASLWDSNMKDLQLSREQFDKYFYDHDKQQAYLPRLLVPFIENSLPHLLLFGALNYFNICKVWGIFKYEFNYIHLKP